MAHKFDPKNLAKLDNPLRRKMLPPGETLKRAGLKKGDTFADIGAGVGYFTFPALEIVGRDGFVFAVDTSPDMLAELEKRYGKEIGGNIKTVKSGEYDFGIKPESVTFAFLCNVLHEIDDKTRFLKNILRILKAGGKLAVIDWQKIEGSIGPPVNHRIDRDDASFLLEKSGFKDILAEDINEHLYSVAGYKKL